MDLARSPLAGVERLEARLALSAVPYGAQPLDTGEFMLGDVDVTVVFFESDGSLEASTEDWDEPHRNEVKQAIEEGLTWWEDMLALQTNRHHLNFDIDYQYADTPIPIGIEPISHTAYEFETWVGTFLDHVEAERTGDIENDIRLFNHERRLESGSHWAFTIFVINSQEDKAQHGEGFFPGEIRGAFSLAGGAFIATPSTRPASTIAHEAAHQFWAMDEYTSNPNYFSQRGYYNTQNLNSPSGHPDPDSTVVSLMAGPADLREAYEQYESSPSSLESIGWRDSDEDGIFDVLDVPLHFSASATFDPTSQLLHVVGSGNVGVLPNLNSAGLQNSITINRLGRIEYRVDGGAWQPGPELNAYEAEVDFSLQFPDSVAHVVEFRLVDQSGYIFSEVFTASTDTISSGPVYGFSGSVVHDIERDGIYTPGERGLAGWKVTVHDAQGNEVLSQVVIEPDAFGQNHIYDNDYPGIKLSAVGSDVDSSFSEVSFRSSTLTSTGTRAFFSSDNGIWVRQWSQDRQLKIEFETPVSRIALDAIADSDGDVAHLELYDANGHLLDRYTTSTLMNGEMETMVVELDFPSATYAIARGHVTHSVALDNLRIGRPNSATTNALGGFILPFDIAGDFQLVALPPSGDEGKFELPPAIAVTLDSSGQSPSVSMAATVSYASWSNQVIRGDINDDGIVDSEDLQLLLNELQNPVHSEPLEGYPRQFTASHLPGDLFLDVNGDGLLSTYDLLKMKNRLLEPQSSGTSEMEPTDWVIPIAPPTNDVIASVSLVDDAIADFDAEPVLQRTASDQAIPAGSHLPSPWTMLNSAKREVRKLEFPSNEARKGETTHLGGHLFSELVQLQLENRDNVLVASMTEGAGRLEFNLRIAEKAKDEIFADSDPEILQLSPISQLPPFSS